MFSCNPSFVMPRSDFFSDEKNHQIHAPRERAREREKLARRVFFSSVFFFSLASNLNEHFSPYSWAFPIQQSRFLSHFFLQKIINTFSHEWKDTGRRVFAEMMHMHRVIEVNENGRDVEFSWLLLPIFIPFFPEPEIKKNLSSIKKKGSRAN